MGSCVTMLQIKQQKELEHSKARDIPFLHRETMHCQMFSSFVDQYGSRPRSQEIARAFFKELVL